MRQGEVKISKVCRVKTSTKKYKKRKGFLGTSKYVNTNVNNDVNNNLNIEDTFSSFQLLRTRNYQQPKSLPHRKDRPVTLVSQKKVLPLKNAIESIISGYIIIDTVILNSIFGEMKYPVCSSFGLFVTEESAKKKGLASSVRSVHMSAAFTHLHVLMIKHLTSTKGLSTP